MNFLTPYTVHTDNNSRTERLRFLLLTLFACSLPYHIFYSQVILGVLVLATLLDLQRKKLKTIPKQVWVFTGLYLLGLLGYIYSTDKKEAGLLLERQLAILLIPFALPLALDLTRARREKILLAFSWSNAITVVFLLLQVLYTVVSSHLPLRAIFSDIFLNHQFSRPIGIHATYMSLYASLSLVYQVHRFFTQSSRRQKTISFLLAGILLTGLLFLASRTILTATFIILVFIMPLFTVRRKLLYMTVAVGIVIAATGLVARVDYFKKRFGKELVKDLYASPGNMKVEGTSAEPRIERWKGAIALIKRSPLIGYGTGDEIKMLKIMYAQRLLVISLYSDFNAHNQYLSYALKNGLIGLAFFLATFGYFLYLGIRHKDVMYVAFTSLLLIGFVTENILDSNKGIFFFALFNTLFAYILLKEHAHKKTDPV